MAKREKNSFFLWAFNCKAECWSAISVLLIVGRELAGLAITVQSEAWCIKYVCHKNLY